MRRFVSTMLVSGLTLTLASCASVPSQDQLVSGIDQTKLAQTTTTKRLASDPVCTDFYGNVAEFQKSAQSNAGKKNFLSSLGLSVASAVLVGQVVPSGISSTTGRMAAYSAAGAVASQGNRAALRELRSSKRADKKIIEVADQLGCPVTVVP